MVAEEASASVEPRVSDEARLPGPPFLEGVAAHAIAGAVPVEDEAAQGEAAGPAEHGAGADSAAVDGRPVDRRGRSE